MRALSGTLVWCFIACLAWGLPAAAQSGPSRPKTQKQETKTEAPSGPVVLVFPPDTLAGAGDLTVDVITEGEESRLNASHAYQPLAFLRSLPTIRRGLNDGTLSNADVTPPFEDVPKLKKLAQAAGVNFVLATAFDTYHFDPEKGQIHITLNARLIDFSGAKPEVHNATAGGVTPEKSAQHDTDVAAARQLVRSLTGQLMDSLLPKPAPASAAPAARRGPDK